MQQNPLLQACLNKSALVHNYNQIKKITNNSLVLAMIKANAYGHNLLKISEYLNFADGFGVAQLQEAIILRNSNIKIKIIVMSGFFTLEDLEIIDKLNLEPVVHDFYQIDLLEKYYANKKINNKINIWLKIDTGMNRLGIDSDLFLNIYNKLLKIKNINIETIMTHFSDADLNNSKTNMQIEKVNRLIIQNKIKKPISMANSAAILKYPSSHANWVRPGIMLYGVSPFEKSTGLDFNLKPVMTLRTKIIAVKNCKKGETIGYGSDYVCKTNKKIGVIAVGYADGYPRKTNNISSSVLVNNKITKTIGRISMDLTTIDLTDIDNVNINDRVILWGEGLPVENIASELNVLPHELLSGLGTRVNYN